MNYSEYNHHPVRLITSQILSTLAHPVFAEPVIADSVDGSYARDKIFSVVTRLVDELERTPGQLASAHGLAQLQGPLQQVLNELVAITQGGGMPNLMQAGIIVDQQIQQLFWAMTPDSPFPEKSPLPQLLTQHTQAVETTIRRLAEQRDEISQRLLTVSQSAADLQTQLNALQEGAAKERAETAATVARLELAYAEKDNERTQSSMNTLNSMRTEFNTLLDNSSGAAKTIIEELTKKREEAAQIVQVVGNIGTTGNYQQIAQAEADQANIWRRVTVGIFVTGIALAVSTFVKFWAAETTVDTAISIAVRLLYAIAITSPAWYTAKESARHRTNADRAKQTELELASIGPFIELLPNDKKDGIREELTKKYFGRDVSEHTVKTPLELGDMKDVILAAIGALGKGK